MLRLHLPRASYDLFVYDFPYGFHASYGNRVISLTDQCKVVDRTCGDRREIVR